MQKGTKNIMITVVATLVIAAAGAGAAAYFINSDNNIAKTETSAGTPASLKTKTTTKVAAKNDMPWKNGQANNTIQQQPQQKAAPCNDSNVVGMGLGAIAGGVLGNQIGKGKGNTAATIGGAVVGGYAGQQMIPTNGVACR